MPQGATLRVENLQGFMQACTRGEKETKKYVRDTLRPVGDIVKHDAQTKLSSISSRSASGYRTRVRQRGVAVEQSLRKTTGTRPDWGRTQMRKALLPAQAENEERVVHEFERAIDKVADHFERTP